MASKTFARTALRASKQKIAIPTVPKRSFVSAPKSRPVVAQTSRAAIPAVQTRGVKTIDFAGVKEDVYGKHFHNLKQPLGGSSKARALPQCQGD